MISKIKSFGIVGIEGYVVDVEIHIAKGMTAFTLVGLPDASVKESKERVYSAIRNSGSKYPVGKIVINLAPASTKKEGVIYDLPIALGILAATDELDHEKLSEYAFVGELSLGGEIRRVNGILPILITASQMGIKKVIVPSDNAVEAGYIEGIDVYTASNLSELIRFFASSSCLAKPYPYKNRSKLSARENKSALESNSVSENQISRKNTGACENEGAENKDTHTNQSTCDNKDAYQSACDNKDAHQSTCKNREPQNQGACENQGTCQGTCENASESFSCESPTLPKVPKRSFDKVKNEVPYTTDLKFVKGQYMAKRALEIAAAGGHNILLIGPPGSGKTMLAKCFPTILPDLTFSESIEATKIHSISGTLDSADGIIVRRPFRTPHHTASLVSLAGGGTRAKPGEISLAHHGVLFLDEMPEYPRSCLEMLRQPIEDNCITIARASTTVAYPASFTLIASMNPCPCGYYGSRTHKCVCTPTAIQKYLSRLSGPLMDRIDLHIEVDSVKYDDLVTECFEEESAKVKERVNRARSLQLQRFESSQIFSNAKMSVQQAKKYCKLTPECDAILKTAFEKLNLSARAHARILRVARTIADLDECENIERDHIIEAISYRSLDRRYVN